MGRKERKFQAKQAELNRNFQSAEAQKTEISRLICGIKPMSIIPQPTNVQD